MIASLRTYACKSAGTLRLCFEQEREIVDGACTSSGATVEITYGADIVSLDEWVDVMPGRHGMVKGNTERRSAFEPMEFETRFVLR